MTSAEQRWQEAYSRWWIAVKERRWDDEQRLRNEMSAAWTRVPETDKQGAWGRYRDGVGWPIPHAALDC